MHLSDPDFDRDPPSEQNFMESFHKLNDSVKPMIDYFFYPSYWNKIKKVSGSV